jgi:hypothetical protein
VQIEAEDVVFNDLRVRVYEPEGNLRGLDTDSAPVAPLPPSRTRPR